MSKHTPGPWVCLAEHHAIADTGDYDACYAVRSKSGAAIVSIWGESEEEHANAKLIAAAPELLEALGEVLPLIKFTDDAGWEKVKRARISYEKATGAA